MRSLPQLTWIFSLLLSICASGGDVSSGISSATRRLGARKRPLLVFISLIEPPFLYADPKDIGRGNRRFKGFVPDLVQRIATKMKGYRHQIKLVTHGGYGVEDAMGWWNGMVGEVIRGEAAVAIGALSIRPSRSAVVHFTMPIMETGITAVLRTPQGSDLPILRPTDLANQANISYGCIKGTQTYYYFKNSKAPVIKNMWQSMSSSEDNFVPSSKEGVQRVRDSNGTFAFLVESLFGEYLASQPPCELQVLGTLLHPARYALAVNKNSSKLLDELNDALTNLKDNGVLERLRTKWWKGRCDVMTESLPEHVYDNVDDEEEEVGETLREHYLQDVRTKSASSSSSPSFLSHTFIRFFNFYNLLLVVIVSLVSSSL